MQQAKPTPQTPAKPAAPARTVVMGMGTITPAIREHLGKSLKAPQPAKTGR